jgi:hypothetical protein
MTATILTAAKAVVVLALRSLRRSPDPTTIETSLKDTEQRRTDAHVGHLRRHLGDQIDIGKNSRQTPIRRSERHDHELVALVSPQLSFSCSQPSMPTNPDHPNS